MTAQNRTLDQQQHVESHAPYLTVFFILLNYTAMEYIFAKYHTAGSTLTVYLIGTALALTILTAVIATIYKLRFNRKWVYLTMIPAVVLALLPIGLIPGLMVLAVTKAALVGIWFMHLKFEGIWVYYMLVPAGILAIIFITALYPDMAMQPTTEQQDAQEENLSNLVRPITLPGVLWS